MNVLHITNTNINYDNRILKELDALEQTELYKLIGIGIKTEDGSQKTKKLINAQIVSLSVLSTKLKWLPRSIKYTFTIFELTIKLIIRGIKLNPNIVHCHDTMVLPAGAFIKMFSNAKLIYDAHELESNKNGQNKILSKATLFIEKIFWPKIDHFISVSNSIIDFYKNALGPKPNSIIFNSPLIENLTNNRERYFHYVYNIPQNKLVFVYLGILGQGRAIDLIIEAFSNELIKSHVVFVGYGELSTKIQEIAIKKSNIHLHKPVSHEEVVALVQNADIGLCLIEKASLSDYYCLPNKLFEYTFAGLPVLASDFPDISSIVNKYKLGKCCAIDSNSILQAIYELETTPPERITSDISELGWEKQAAKLTNAYSELLKIV